MEHGSSRPHEMRQRNLLPGMFDWFLLVLIGFYQRHLSPRKGWRCAYSVLHGGPGCSGFAREAIQAHGYGTAAPLIRQRFRECKQASQAMRAFSDGGSGGSGPLPGPGPGSGRRPRNTSTDWCDCSGLDACDGCELLQGCSNFHIGSCHGCDSCDLGGCHGCDGCGGCDCTN